MSAARGHVEIVELLLRSGADPDLANDIEKTARGIANLTAGSVKEDSEERYRNYQRIVFELDAAIKRGRKGPQQ